MSVRFRIRTSAGQELSFATLAMFEDFVRSGDLSPDDLVYDAEDGSWSPARTHPTVLEIEYQKEEEAAAAERAAEADKDTSTDGPSAAESSDAAGEGRDPEPEVEEDTSFGLSLAPEQPTPEAPGGGASEPVDPVEQLVAESSTEGGEDPIDAPGAGNAFGLELAIEEKITDEEATRAFVERMEAERESSLEYGVGAGFGGLKMDDSSTLAEMITPDAPPAEIAPRPAHTAPPPREPRPRSPRPPATSGAGTGRARGGGGGGIGRLFLLLIGLGIIGGAGYFGYQTFGPTPAPTPAPTDPVEPMPLPEPEAEAEPVIAQTEAAIRERAQERFLTATQNALRDLPPIPGAWATGTYFAAPSEHARALQVWEGYLRTIRSVRTGDARRYADAYDLALDDAAIADDTRARRRETALADFATSAEARAAHYDRVEALASAAIQSHAALLEAEGLILYEPGSSAGGDSGMGAGAYGRDSEAELLLAQVIDLLSGRLDSDGLGPGDGANVRAWVWDGFLDAATR